MADRAGAAAGGGGGGGGGRGGGGGAAAKGPTHQRGALVHHARAGERHRAAAIEAAAANVARAHSLAARVVQAAAVHRAWWMGEVHRHAHARVHTRCSGDE